MQTKHDLRDANGHLHRLTPKELDELNRFPRVFTLLDGVHGIDRAKSMGNALLTGVVARVGLAMAAHPGLEPA